MQVTVRAVTRDGRPSLVEFRFAEPLQSPHYQWLVWRSGRLVEWQIPNVGESVSTP
jgi:phage baseplate assembly protein gpV